MKNEMSTWFLLNKKCIIFDLDGCLVDTERAYQLIWREVFLANDVDISLEHISSWTGLAWNSIREEIKGIVGEDEADRLRELREELFFQKLFKGDVSLKPAVMAFLQLLKDKGYTLVLGTSTYRNKALKILEYFNLLEYFDFVVFGDDVAKTKPAPDIFERCVALAQVDKTEALIFEDSLNGLKAANAALVDVVFVPDIHYYSKGEIDYLCSITSFEELL